MGVLTAYSYTNSNGFNEKQLRAEIDGLDIVIAIDHFDYNNPSLKVFFKDVLNVDEKALLDPVAAGHTPDLSVLDDQVDKDGALYSRKKITDNGDHFQARFFTFGTATKDSLSCRGYDGVETGESSLRFYNEAGTDITDQTQSVLNSSCVRTEIDFKPPFDFKIMKGGVTLDHDTSDNKAILFTRMAPLLGSQYGEKDMIHGLPLRSIKAGDWKMFDGEAPKPIKQANFSGTPNFTTRVWHAPGSKIIIFSEFILFKA